MNNPQLDSSPQIIFLVVGSLQRWAFFILAKEEVAPRSFSTEQENGKNTQKTSNRPVAGPPPVAEKTVLRPLAIAVVSRARFANEEHNPYWKADCEKETARQTMKNCSP